MFYQGVGAGPAGTTVHAIAIARSSDRVTWTCDPAPILTFDDLRGVYSPFTAATGGGVIEPAIVQSGDGLAMYFVAYAGSYREGSFLFRATSADGRTWAIDRDWMIAGTQFGRFRLHYPEVVSGAAGLTLWFSLIDLETGCSAICTMTSADGRHFARLQQVLPATPTPPAVHHRDAVSLAINGIRPRGLSRLNQAISAAIWNRRNYLGYAHSHVDRAGGGMRLYYHAYHLDARQRVWMDIGRCALDGGATTAHTTVLTPAAAANAWDAFFVADPFVLTS
jgi:hypothetical protein